MTRLDATFAALVLIQVVHSVEHSANPRNCHPAGPPEAQDPQGLEGDGFRNVSSNGKQAGLIATRSARVLWRCALFCRCQ